MTFNNHAGSVIVNTETAIDIKINRKTLDQCFGPTVIVGTPGYSVNRVTRDYLRDCKKPSSADLCDILVFCEPKNAHWYTNFIQTDSFFSKATGYIYPSSHSGKWDDRVIELLQFHFDQHKQMFRHYVRNKANDGEFHTLFIVMESFHSVKVRQSNVFQEIIQHKRAWRTTLILHEQHAGSLPPSLRACMNYIIIGKQRSKINKNRAWDCYVGIVPTFKMFKDLHDKLTEEDDNWILVEQTCCSTRIEDVVFWFKTK